MNSWKTIMRKLKKIIYKMMRMLMTVIKQRMSHAVPMLICHSPSLYLKFLVKKGHYSKTIAFRVILLPIVLQLQLVMMSKYSMLSADTFKTFWVMSYIKFLHDGNNEDDLAITIAWLFLQNIQAKNHWEIY